MFGMNLDDMGSVDIYIVWKDNGSFVIAADRERARLYGSDIDELRDLRPSYASHVMLWTLIKRLGCGEEIATRVMLSSLLLLAVGTGIVEYDKAGDVWVVKTEIGAKGD